MGNSIREIVFILDRSGSMAPLAESTISGFNSMMRENRKYPGKALVTTVMFNHRISTIYTRKPMSAGAAARVPRS